VNQHDVERRVPALDLIEHRLEAGAVVVSCRLGVDELGTDHPPLSVTLRPQTASLIRDREVTRGLFSRGHAQIKRSNKRRTIPAFTDRGRHRKDISGLHYRATLIFFSARVYLYRPRILRLTLLPDPGPGGQAIIALRDLVARVEVRHDGSGWTVELQGALEALMALGLVKEKEPRPRLSAEALCSAKVVARVGFEPTTFRL
jgi:hypothetical protein